MAAEVDYGAWWHYSFARTAGLELDEGGLWDQPPVTGGPGNIRLTSMSDRRDRGMFAGAYDDVASGTGLGSLPAFPQAVGPISYTGHEQVQRDISNMKAGLSAAGFD